MLLNLIITKKYSYNYKITKIYFFIIPNHHFKPQYAKILKTKHNKSWSYLETTTKKKFGRKFKLPITFAFLSLSLSNIKFYLPKPLNLLKSLTFPVWSLSSLINLLKRLLFKRFIKKYEEKKNSNTLSTKLPVLRREKEYLYSLFCLFANWPLRILMFFIFLPIFLTNTNVTPNFLIV
jgi:hypothetical protein